MSSNSGFTTSRVFQVEDDALLFSAAGSVVFKSQFGSSDTVASTRFSHTRTPSQKRSTLARLAGPASRQRNLVRHNSWPLLNALSFEQLPL